MSWDDLTLADLLPWLDDDPAGVFPVELCEGGCGMPRSFCNCGAPWPIGRGR